MAAEQGGEENDMENNDNIFLVILSLIHISEPTRLRRISYAVFCLKKKKNASTG